MVYEFQHADICARAREAFREAPSDVHEAVQFSQAAKHVDVALGILKRGYDQGYLSEHDYDDLTTHLEDAEEILETLGVLEDHEYIRDDIEPRAVELLDLDSVDVSDDALEFDNTESWLFGKSEDD